MPRLTRSEVEILKFNGKYQLLSNESPCLSCETETVKPTSYSISSVIGTGSFGQVYKVKEIKTGKGLILIGWFCTKLKQRDINIILISREEFRLEGDC